MQDKQEIRELVWNLLESSAVVRGRSVHDRIPAFHGAQEAAERIFELDVWKEARVIKCNPDQPQRPLRKRALEDGKILYMAVPRLRQEACFVELDPAAIGASPAQASTIAGAFRYGRPVKVEEMQHVDLVISGSVAVNWAGARVGKGGGFADLEYGLAMAAGILDPTTPVVTTVHELQLLDDELPSTPHDVPLDYLATPERLIRCSGESPKPLGIYWDDLNEKKISEIPVLQRLRESR